MAFRHPWGGSGGGSGIGGSRGRRLLDNNTSNDGSRSTTQEAAEGGGGGSIDVSDIDDNDDQSTLSSSSSISTSNSKSKDPSRQSQAQAQSGRSGQHQQQTIGGGGGKSGNNTTNEDNNFDDNLAEKSLQFRMELEEVLQSIPDEFQRPDFSFIRVVARALQSPKGIEAEKHQLEEYFNILDEEVTRVVDEYYKGFNKSIRHFSDILTYLKDAQDNVSVLKKQVIKCMELLTSRSEDLATLYANSLHQSELQRLLQHVDEVKEGPRLVDEAISKKHHLHAVKLIEKYLRMFQWQIPKNIRALKEIQQEMEDKQKLLPEIIIEDLHRHVFLRGGAEKFQQAGVDDELVASSTSTPDAPSSSSSSSSSKNLLRLASFYRSGVPDEIIDDPDVNPELDSRSFMRLCIEALDKLDMLPRTHSVFLQRLKTEIGSIIDVQITQFMESLDMSGTELLRILAMPESYRAVRQGAILNSLLEQLCTKLVHVLRNLQFVIDVMNKKAAQKSLKKGNAGNANLSFKAGDSILDEMLITRDTLLKIRTKIVEELESAQVGDKQTDTFYFAAMEKLLATLIQDGEKFIQQPRSLKLRSIVDMFGNLLRAEMHAARQQQQQQQLERAQLMREQEKRHHLRGLISTPESTSESIEDFSHGIFSSTAESRLEAMSSKLTDTFVALFVRPENQTTITLKFVWDKMQEEVVSVLRELLGVNIEELMNMEKQRHTRKEEIHEVTARMGTIPRPKFRFAINIEALSNHDHGPTLNLASSKALETISTEARCSRLCPTFIFLPHNMIWIFKVLRQFVDQVTPIIGAATTAAAAGTASSQDASSTDVAPNANTGTGTIGDIVSIGLTTSTDIETNLLNDINKFMDNTIQLVLIPKMLLDYRTQMNDLLKGKDAFRPRDHGEDYDDEDDTRPLLHSAYQLAIWMRELFQYSLAIPYSNDMFEIMESLLRKYLDECREQFQHVMEGKIIAEFMAEPRGSDLASTFEKDPSWEVIRENSTIMHIHSAPSYLGKDEFEVLLREKVDDRIASRTQLDKGAIITDTSPLILLANLHDSLEWVSEQILAICKAHRAAKRNRLPNVPLGSIASGSRGRPDSVSSMASLDSDDSASVTSSATQGLPFAVSSPMPFSKHFLLSSASVASSGGSSTLAAGAPASQQQQQQQTQQAQPKNLFVSFAFEQHFNSFRNLSNRCLWAIKIDLRTRCFVHLEPIKMGDYNCQEETNEPESFVKNFNQDISHVEKCLTPYLPTYKLQYLFEGLGLLIANVLISALGSMKIRKFNAQGVLKMRRNIFAIQQNIANIIASQEQHFNRARQYYDLLNFTEKQFFAHVSESHAFTQDEYKAILLTETPLRQLNNNALVVLANMFQQFRQQSLPRAQAPSKH